MATFEDHYFAFELGEDVPEHENNIATVPDAKPDMFHVVGQVPGRTAEGPTLSFPLAINLGDPETAARLADAHQRYLDAGGMHVVLRDTVSVMTPADLQWGQ